MLAQGKLDAAREAHEQSLAIAERLAKADPSNSGWQHVLSVSYGRLGDVETAAGKLDAARQAYEQSLAIAERLAKADPSNSGWQRELWVFFENGRAISERLTKLDPSNAVWKNDLAWVNGKIAKLKK